MMKMMTMMMGNHIWDEAVGAGVVRDDENALGVANAVRADAPPQGQAAAAANQPVAEGPAALMRRMRKPMQMLRMTWKVLWRVCFSSFLFLSSPMFTTIF
jgi:hypothetical protein